MNRFLVTIVFREGNISLDKISERLKKLAKSAQRLQRRPIAALFITEALTVLGAGGLAIIGANAGALAGYNLFIYILI